MLYTYRKLLDIMTPVERRKFWLLALISFVLSAIEAASVVSILPFLQLLAEPGLIETNAILARAYAAFGYEDVTSFQIAIGVIVFCITIVGLAMKTLTVWLTTKFAMMRSYSLSARLLQTYLHQPYEWFLSRHSSELGTAILVEADRVVRESLLPAMRLIPEAFTTILLIVALCAIEPEIALGGAALLGGIYGGIFLMVRNLLTRHGRIQTEMNSARFHVVQEATGGVKELKIMGLEHGFLESFRHAAYRLARVQTVAQVISALPRYALEAVAFGGMIVLVLVLLVRSDGGIAALVPTLGLIAAIGMRLIPALQQVYARGASLRNTQAALEKIHKDMVDLGASEINAAAAPDTTDRRLLTETLELRGITYSYPGTDRSALNGLDMTIEANTTIGIVGGTGAGKTTLVDIILGLLDAHSGEMIVDQARITPDTRRSWQRTLGYVPQTIFLSDSTMAENIAFGLPREKIDMARVEAAARTAALHEFVMNELPNGYDTLVGERGTRLSGGQRQRVGIARALFHDPTTLIFDEATSALDTLTEAAVMEAVHAIAGQKTIIMIAHRLSTVRDCDRIFLLRQGRVAAAGTFDELIAEDPEFRKMAGNLATAQAAEAP